MPLFTQSGRAVKRRLPNPDSVFDAILAESEFDAHGGGTGAGVKGASASGRKPAKRARARTSTPIAAVAAPAEAMPATVGPAARDPATAPPALQARDASPNVVAPKPSVPAGEAGRPDPAAAALPSASTDASLGPVADLAQPGAAAVATRSPPPATAVSEAVTPGLAGNGLPGAQT